MSNRVGWLLLALVVAGAAAYFVLTGPSEGELESIAQRWFRAVQERDFESLARVDMAAPPEREGAAFAAWCAEVNAGIGRYEDGREEGFFEPDPTGYAIARGAMLGSGTFWESQVHEQGFRRPALEIKLNFGYGEIMYGGLPRGTTVFLLGHPLGTVNRIRLGDGATHEIPVLEHLTMRVEFERTAQQQGEDERYKVTRVQWLTDSAEHRLVKWIF